jgi:hypothetical protein
MKRIINTIRDMEVIERLLCLTVICLVLSFIPIFLILYYVFDLILIVYVVYSVFMKGR